jgi:hypothetical protein
MKIFPMSQTRQILLAFLLPFILGVSSAFLGDRFFFLGCPYGFLIHGEMACSSSGDSTSLTAQLYVFLIVGLFLASLILPPFLTRRVYQSKRNNIEI